MREPPLPCSRYQLVTCCIAGTLAHRIGRAPHRSRHGWFNGPSAPNTSQHRLDLTNIVGRGGAATTIVVLDCSSVGWPQLLAEGVVLSCNCRPHSPPMQDTSLNNWYGFARNAQLEVGMQALGVGGSEGWRAALAKAAPKRHSSGQASTPIGKGCRVPLRSAMPPRAMQGATPQELPPNAPQVVPSVNTGTSKPA